MADITYDTLPLLGQGFSLDLAGKGHAIAKRVWATKADMLAYISDATSSAVRGLILVVVDDTEENNGAYLVKQAVGDNGVKSLNADLAIVKLSTGEWEQITIAEDTVDIASIENNKLHIQDMRTYWDDQSF